MGRRRWDRAFLPSHPANLCWHQVLLGVHVTRFKQICLDFTHSHVLLGTVHPCPLLLLESLLPTCRQGLFWVNPKSRIAASPGQSLSNQGVKEGQPQRDHLRTSSKAELLPTSRLIPPVDTGSWSLAHIQVISATPESGSWVVNV